MHWVNEFASLEEQRVVYRCKLCAGRGTSLIWKNWRVCIENPMNERKIYRTHHMQANRIILRIK